MHQAIFYLLNRGSSWRLGDGAQGLGFRGWGLGGRVGGFRGLGVCGFKGLGVWGVGV